MDCRAPFNEAMTARSLSLATMYLLTGWRDWWGTTAFYAQFAMRYWNIDNDTVWMNLILDKGTHPRPDYSEYGHTIAPRMIDATIPVNGDNWSGGVKNWATIHDRILKVMADNAWNFRWIPFANGKGMIPTGMSQAWSKPIVPGVAVKQGSVSTTLMGVYAAKNPPRLLTGHPMPATGYMMVVPPANGSFTAGPLTIANGSVTADATGPDRSGLLPGSCRDSQFPEHQRSWSAVPVPVPGQLPDRHVPVRQTR